MNDYGWCLLLAQKAAFLEICLMKNPGFSYGRPPWAKVLYYCAIYQLSTNFIYHKNHVYKNVKAHICAKSKNAVVILLAAISIFF